MKKLQPAPTWKKLNSLSQQPSLKIDILSKSPFSKIQ